MADPQKGKRKKKKNQKAPGGGKKKKKKKKKKKTAEMTRIPQAAEILSAFMNRNKNML